MKRELLGGKVHVEQKPRDTFIGARGFYFVCPGWWV